MNEFMDQAGWHQKEHLDPSFPCRVWETSMYNGFASHWHELLEVVYVQKGRLKLDLNGQLLEIKADDIVVINSGIIHKYSKADAGTSIIIFQFGLELFDQTLVDLRDHAFQKLVFDRKKLFTSEDDDVHCRISQLLLFMQKEYNDRKMGFRLAIRSSLYTFALIFLREIPAKPLLRKEQVPRNYEHQKLERILSYIHGNAHNPDLTLEKAAKSAALSKFYFTRFFREQTGQTFHSYLSRVRVHSAEKYLIETDMSVTEIAYMCGFGSLETFNRLFKTYTGTTPSTYRISY